MAFFVVYHILIVGFVVNFCYVVLVLVSPKCRYDLDRSKSKVHYKHARYEQTLKR